ncbi:alpha/beta hydrolase [Roseomonas aerophila]|uniref:Alpha/beta hydrolase n=1 Tax=Teichococcus aerophilus TaxID=1224513 RepID=A0ABR7RHH4_9PROT|nr:alpha/beta hydrolase [Pseudoroseomonas aerophila]MBC9205883.1 alpha/beta hydrolase [Pseudoroseomonas aerophila]
MQSLSRRASLFLPFGLAATLAACATETMPTTPPDPTGRADPQMRALLESLAQLGGKPIETLTPAEARRQPTMADAVKARQRALNLRTDPREIAQVRDLQIPGAGAFPLEARLYNPAPTPPRGQPIPRLPLIVYYHGGGFVIADLDTYDASARTLAADTGAMVLAVHYRQGPENRFPTAHDDAYAAYVWALQNAGQLNIDLSRVAVVGESAGGNLAINVAMMAREARQPLPVAMGLIYPVAGTDMTTQSYRENAMAKPLNAAMMRWFVQHYTNGPTDLRDPRLNVAEGAELRGLPKAIIVTAEIDPLRSEGQLLAQKLQVAGVQVSAEDFPGVTHEFFGADPAVLSKAGDAQRFVAGELRTAFLAPAAAVVAPQPRGRRVPRG